ncbi:lysylphosphatidylglycerol synthase transmembrane domain-containing protein [Edaphobacter sp.]|uniref:lysylphosphatidylglycerol synthase transmembrane domain-containing protein n=1 Tax=Edaphobacter sp. TaxID=1934404 RepID=UPI002DB9F28A|nr:lysylphosphatidylglycerol synthase transmembrane domain-containing protein [Edaphobacter sp.]HEU5340330.1 lysylphosphatidylglycerol synthase transmembrane domain-containing protein [Edaphobacter sp.]
MNKRKLIFWAVVVAALAVLVAVFRDKVHFDWKMFWQQLRFVSWRHIWAGIALIYATYWLRSVRWAVFLSPTKKVPAVTLLGPQFIGFTAVALFGRLADLTRPYLVARRVELPLSTQVAVYTIERMFDLGAAALVFSSALAFTPKTLPHHDVFVRAGVVSLALTLVIAVFAGVVRLAGGVVAGFARGTVGLLSKSAGESISSKILGFRDGLNALKSAKDFGVTAAISLLMWLLIGWAYVQTAHAFVHTPELASLTFSRTMLLMAASIGGSLLQLPIIGWFTQIAVTAAAMHEFYGAPIEAATACGALLLLVTFLCIIPTGLVYSQIEHVSLKKIADESGAAKDATIAADAGTAE